MDKKVIALLAVICLISFVNSISIDLDWVYPTTNINVTQDIFFNVSVNVSCKGGDCGAINLTLDPTPTIYNFTTCGQTGKTGPNQSDCDTNYSGTTLDGGVTINTIGIQEWTVPSTGTYTIEAVGAKGGGAGGGLGAKIQGDFELEKDTVIKIIVGQRGTKGSGSAGSSNSGGGGGGTFVVDSNNSIYVIAGGGGGGNGDYGATYPDNATGSPANTHKNGSSTYQGGGGTNGSGGNSGITDGPGAGGGGFNTNGQAGSSCTGGASFLNNGTGGTGSSGAYKGGDGGFGGGGGGYSNILVRGGGGGGYSGGQGATYAYSTPTVYASSAAGDKGYGGGGGSFKNGTNQNNTASFNSGEGYVTITFSGGAKSGTISTNVSATPFYTNTTNPYNLTLNQDESQIITWWVNATGNINITSEFFAYVNQTANESISNVTSKLNITILDLIYPVINITYPTNTTHAVSLTALNYTYSDSNAGHCWYSTDNGVTNSTTETAGTNWTGLDSGEGSHTWIVYCNDSSGNENSSSITFTSSIPQINLDWIYPTTNINVSENEFFNITVNISCTNNDCNAVNVSLDPAEPSEHYDDFETDFGHWDESEGIGCSSTDAWGNRVTSTSSSSTGPTGGVGGAGTYFIYVETSSSNCGTAGDIALVYFNQSIDYDSSINEKIEFHFHAYGSAIDDLYLEENSTGTWVKIWEMHDNNENLWNFTSVDLSDLTGTGSLRFNYTRTSSTYTSDIALDRINITYTSGAKSGLVSTNNTATPFYTNITNPYNLSLNNGESQLITWWVNATGNRDIDYEFFVYANKTADQSVSNITSKLNITIKDTIAPTINITYPLNTTYATSITELNYTYSDSNGEGDCWYSTNNGETNSSTESAGTNWTGLDSGGGSHTWIVYCNDSSGNENSSSITFTSSIPVINLTLLSPTTDVNVTQNQFFQVQVRLDCSNNDCGAINVSLDPASNLVTNGDFENGLTGWTTGGNANWFNQSTTKIEGSYAAEGGNIADNQNTWINQTVTLTKAANLTFQWKVSSEGSYDFLLFCNNNSACTRTSGYTARISGSTSWATKTYELTAGTHVLHWLYAKDGSVTRNSDTGWIDNVTISGSTKSGIISTTEGTTPFYTNITNPYNISLNQDQSETIGWWVNATGTLNTSHTFFIYANKTSDKSISAITETWNVTILSNGSYVSGVDQTAPAITFDLTNNSYSSNTELDINFSIVENNISSCWYSNDTYSINTTITCGTNITDITWTEGKHNLTVWANDSNANNGSASLTFTIDTTNPNATLLSPTNNSYNTTTNSQNFTVNLTDLLGISNATLFIYNSSNNLINQTTSTFGENILTYTLGIVVVLADGLYDWFYQILDRAGNIFTTSNYTLTVDATNPKISIVIPPNNTYTTNTEIDINYTVSDFNLSSCWYSNDTYSVNTTITCGTNITSITWSEGQHNVTIWANDTGGYENSSTIILTIDLTNPQINITSPTNNTNSSNNQININYTASDTNLDSCWYSNDTHSTNTTLANCNNLTTITWSEGQHNVTIWANDSAGNTNNSKIIFTIDTIPPNLSIITPSNNTYTNKTNQNINYTTGADAQACWYSNDSYSVNTSLVNCANLTSVVWSEGQHNITIYTNDSFGNINSSLIRLTIDTIYPSIDITFPINNTNHSNSNLDINYSISEANIDSCWYSNDTYSVNTTLANCNNLTTITWSEGQHNITIWINDSTNHINSSSISFTMESNPPILNFTNPTPANTTTTKNTSIEINISIIDSNLKNLVYNWNGTNYNLFNDSLILMMNFNNLSTLGENDTHIADLSTYSNNGTAKNGVIINKTGKYRGGVHLDGNDDSIFLGTITSGHPLMLANQNVTISAWFYQNTGDTYQRLVDKSSDGWGAEGYTVWLNPSNQEIGICVNGSAHAYRTSSAYTLGQWTHVTAVITDLDFAIYVNGVEDTSAVFDSGDTPIQPSDIETNMSIGTWQHSTGREFNGEIDELRIWNRSLTAAEVYQQYTSNLQKFNQTQWYLYINQSKNATDGLTDGSYTYFVNGTDTNGNSNQTETRTITIDASIPILEFTNPSTANATSTANTSLEINVSISESDLKEVIYNWNGSNFTMYNNSLLLMYNFDNISSLGENDTYVFDVSGNGNNGTGLGAVVNTTGKYNGAFTFDGIDDYISAPYSFGKPNNITISLWFKTSSEGILFNQHNVGPPGNPGSYIPSLWVLSNGSLRAELWTGSTGSIYSTNVSDDNWHFAVLIGDSDNQSLYIDSQFIGDRSGTLNQAWWTLSTIGTGYANAREGYGTVWKYFNGSIDELKIWNYSLSETEIYQQYISNLQKFNSTQWYLYINQSKNATDGLDDGDYTYFISTKDTVSNENKTETRTITINSVDVTAPVINITFPINNSHSSNTELDINFSIVETNISACWYSNDTYSTNTTITCGTNITDITWTEGKHNLTVWANDSNSNNGSASITFTIDTTNPSIEYGTGTETDNKKLARNNIYVNTSVTELNEKNITFNLYYSNNTLVNSTTYTDSTRTINWTNLQNSIYKFNTTIYDNATNSNSTQTRTVTIDTINPKITINSPTSQTYITSSIDFNITSNENLSSCQVSIDNWTSNQTLTINSSLTGAAYTNSSIPDGSYTARFWCNDTTGNINNTETISFTIDTVNPVININHPSNNQYFNYNESININYSILTDGTDSCWYSTDNGITNQTISNCLNITLNLSEGNHAIRLWLNDSANLKGSDIVNFTIDLTSPATNLINPTNNTINNTANTIDFYYNITDTNAISNCSLIINNIINLTVSNPEKNQQNNLTVYLFNSNYNWSINCTDIANNINSSQTRALAINYTVIVDTNEFEGSTTTFPGRKNTSDLRNLTSLTLEKTSYGNINFSENIDLSTAVENLVVNLSKHVNISQNRIEINSTALPPLNKSARLKLYNLTFTTPQILRDSTICPSTICTQESYLAGTLTFNVTSFTVYSARETPTSSDEGESAAGSSGGSGGSTTTIKECTKNSDCNGTYSCHNNKCVKLFDIEILELKSSIDLLSFELKYLIKAMAEINNDIIIKFWIQDSNKKTHLGQDTVYIGNFEEKTKTTKINLPQNIKNKDYDLYIQVNYENYQAESFRKININLPKEILLKSPEEIEKIPSRKSIFTFSSIVMTLIVSIIAIAFILITSLLRKIKTRNFIILIIGISTILILLETYKGNLTGSVIGNKEITQSLAGIIYFISIVGILGLLTFLYKRNILKIKTYKKENKYLKNSINKLIKKKVYTDEGEYIGNIKSIFLNKIRIESLKIKLNKKFTNKKFKGIIVKYNCIKNIGDIVIINNKIKDFFNNNL